MNPTANNTPESWRQSDAALRRALQQRNAALPELPAGFNERMKERMAAEAAATETVTDKTNGASLAETAATDTAPSSQKRHLWPWWSAAAAVAAIVAMHFWPNSEVQDPSEGRPPLGHVIHTETSPEVLATPAPPATEQRVFQHLESSATPSAKTLVASQTASATREKEVVSQTISDISENTLAASQTTECSSLNNQGSEALPDSSANNVQHPKRMPQHEPSLPAIAHSSKLPTTKPDKSSPRLLALALHTSSLGFGTTSKGGGEMTLVTPRYDKSAYNIDNYYYLAGNGFTYSNNVKLNLPPQYNANNTVTINESHHDLPFTLGLTLNVPLSKRLSVETGTTYTLLRSTFDDGNPQNYKHTRQCINYIGIPLQLQYSFILSRACRLYALGGLQVDFPLSAQQTIQRITNGSNSGEITIHPSASVQLAPLAGLGAQLNVTRHLSVFCQPSLQWFAPAGSSSDVSDLQTWRTEHELAFSLPLGLRWTF